MQSSGQSKGALRCAMGALLVTALLTGCGATMVSGDAGCSSYGEARLSMPDLDMFPGGKWGYWIADLDDRMTGTCR
jgi:hypothetical protein